MAQEDNRSFWQRFAVFYGPVMARNGRRLYQDICMRIRPHLRRDMQVLELACGTGQLSYPLSGWVSQWEATDFSSEMIARAKKGNVSRRLHFSVQDATCLPYAPESFDAVVISNALHIMPYPERAMEEIGRVLKPEGMLFAPTFLHGAQSGIPLRVRLMELLGFHTYHKWDESGFLCFLEKYGFQVKEHCMLPGGLAPLCFVRACLDRKDIGGA